MTVRLFINNQYMLMKSIYNTSENISLYMWRSEECDHIAG